MDKTQVLVECKSLAKRKISFKDFRTKHSALYQQAYHKGVLNQVRPWFAETERQMRKIPTTPELIAILSRFENAGEAQRKDNINYELAHHRGILNDIFSKEGYLRNRNQRNMGLQRFPSKKELATYLKKITGKYLTFSEIIKKDPQGTKISNGIFQLKQLSEKEARKILNMWDPFMGRSEATLKEVMVKFRLMEKECLKHISQGKTLNQACIDDPELLRNLNNLTLNHLPLAKKIRRLSWVRKQDRREEGFELSLIAKVKKEAKNYELLPSKFLTQRSRPDMLLKNKRTGKILIVEIKHDDSKWSINHLETQSKKYLDDAKKVFGNKIERLWVVSKTGKYGISEKALLQYLTR